MGFTNNNLIHTTDFPSMITTIIGEGLKSQTDFVQSGMSVANFTNMINNAALTVLNNELRQYGINKKDITEAVNNYQKALNSNFIVATYSGQVNEYRSMVSEFLPVGIQFNDADDRVIRKN